MIGCRSLQTKTIALPKGAAVADDLAKLTIYVNSLRGVLRIDLPGHQHIMYVVWALTVLRVSSLLSRFGIVRDITSRANRAHREFRD